MYMARSTGSGRAARPRLRTSFPMISTSRLGRKDFVGELPFPCTPARLMQTTFSIKWEGSKPAPAPPAPPASQSSAVQCDGAVSAGRFMRGHASLSERDRAIVSALLVCVNLPQLVLRRTATAGIKEGSLQAPVPDLRFLCSHTHTPRLAHTSITAGHFSSSLPARTSPPPLPLLPHGSQCP